MRAFYQLACAIVDNQMVRLVIFDIELENQIKTLGRLGVEVLFEFFEYLIYRHCSTFIDMGVLEIRLYGERSVVSSEIKRLF